MILYTGHGEDIEQADNIKILGVFMDCKSTWNCHIQFVRKKYRESLRYFVLSQNMGWKWHIADFVEMFYLPL